jgi:preprotein translocase subunit SecG
MYTAILTLIVIVSVLLTLVVLAQNSKGGGLASNFSGSNQVMGVRKTTDFIEKATWTLASVLLVLCIASFAFVNKEGTEQATSSVIINEAETQTKTNSDVQLPVFPVETQETQE